MIKLNLTEFLISLDSNTLAEIYVKERLSAIIETIDTSISERAIVNLLKTRYGSQIFSNKLLRGYVIGSLRNEYLSFLLNGKYENIDISDQDKKKLIKLNWNRNIKSIQRLIEIFDLSEDHLPSKTYQKDDIENIKPEHNLFSHQKRIKDKFIKNLKLSKKKMIINMPTGSGKTRTTVEGLVDYWRVLADQKSFVVWMAHSEELCEQAVETIKKTWSIRGENNLKVYRLWGNHSPKFDNDGGFIVTSFAKIYSMMKSGHDEVFKQILKIKSKCFALVVDEAHKSIASTYQDAINYITDKDKSILVGLTATPGRVWNDEENRRLARFFDNTLIPITDENDNEIDDAIKYLQDNGYLAYVITDQVSTDINLDLSESDKKYLNDSLDLPETFFSSLGEHKNRNLCILAQIIKYYQENKSIIVFACSLDHASLLNEICSIKGIKSASIDKDTTVENRRKHIQSYKDGDIKVLINYGVLTTGFDAPNTDVVIITRPTQSPILYSQMIGRGLRGPKVGGNKKCILVDIKDNITGLPNERSTYSMYRDNYQNS